MQKELDAGWGTDSFRRSEGLSSWPEWMCPTSLVERFGSWRLCHDFSWPPPDSVPGLLSPNAFDTEQGLPVTKFARLGDFCSGVAILCVSAAPVTVSKADLSKAYKRTGQQRATVRARATLSISGRGSQTLERVAFGQSDGPSSFSDQTNYFVFIVRRELDYADACYPTADPSVVAFIAARLEAFCGPAEEAPYAARLSFLMAMIDDFGLASIADLLFRIDGTAVLAEDGTQRDRAWLHFEVLCSALRRWGHILEGDKLISPCSAIVLLGGLVDVPSEELSLEDAKRRRYQDRLGRALLRDSATAAELTSLAFKMLVVCEVAPTYRQWLHPIFQLLRNDDETRTWASMPAVRDSFQRFHDLLAGGERLAVPLACRLSFPNAMLPYVLILYMDAAGKERFPVADAPPAGFGAWTVRDRVLYLIYDEWSARELELSITVLEFVTMLIATGTCALHFVGVTHVFELTDNTGAQASADTTTPHTPQMQAVAARRTQQFADAGVFTRAGRVSSADNRWADALSRGQVDRVIAEAAAHGLAVQRLHVPADLRDLEWLLAV